MKVQGTGYLSSTWEAWVQFLAPGFGPNFDPAQPQSMQTFGE